MGWIAPLLVSCGAVPQVERRDWVQDALDDRSNTLPYGNYKFFPIPDGTR